MRIANRPFKPSKEGTIAVLILFPLLLTAGFWQLRRAEEKRTIIEQFRGGESTTQQLTAENVAELPYLQHVTAQGRYEGGRQVLLDNMPSSRGAAGFSQPGYRVLTPLIVAPNKAVLVDRGWIALGSSRTQLPAIDVGDNARSVRGRLAELPSPGIRLGASPTTGSWPRVLNFPTHAQLEALYGLQLMPRILLLDPQEPDGFKRDWSDRYSVAEFGPGKHIGYAVQWFGMGLALVVIYFALALRRPAADETKR